MQQSRVMVVFGQRGGLITRDGVILAASLSDFVDAYESLCTAVRSQMCGVLLHAADCRALRFKRSASSRNDFGMRPLPAVNAGLVPRIWRGEKGYRVTCSSSALLSDSRAWVLPSSSTRSLILTSFSLSCSLMLLLVASNSTCAFQIPRSILILKSEFSHK